MMTEHVSEKTEIWPVNESILLLVAYFGGSFFFPLTLKHMLKQILEPSSLGAADVLDRVFPHVLGGGYLLSSLFLLGLLYMSIVFFHHHDFKKSLKLIIPSFRNVIAAVAVAVALLFIFYLIAYLFKPKGVISPAMKLLNYGGVGMFWFILVVILVGPLLEEVLFRGYLYAGFKNSWGSRNAILAVSTLFAAMHLPRSFIVFLALFIYSIAFIFLLEKSKSLFSSVICHMVINSSALFIYLFVKYVYNITIQF